MAASATQTWTSAPLFERLSQFADRVSGRRLGELFSSSSNVKPSSSPFGNFGVIAASGSRPLPFAQVIKEAAIFTVEEARDRISSFIENRFVPDSVSDLFNYLGEKFLRLETHVVSGGKFANYLVDTKSSKSVPAAQVDQRLSHKAVLGAGLRASLRQMIGRETPADAFHSWQGMRLVLDNSNSGDAYTVSGGQGWYGKIHAMATDDHEKNVEIVRAARERGIDLILPKRQDGPVSTLIDGMPILVKSKSLKAEEVHPALAHAKLSEVFGMGMVETYDKLGERKSQFGGERQPTNVVSLNAFKTKFMRKPDVDEPIWEASKSSDEGFHVFGGSPDDEAKRDFVIRRDSAVSQYYVYDRDIDEEVAIAVNALPAGKYPRQNEDGAQDGYTQVLEGGKVRHFDLDGKALSPIRRASEQYTSENEDEQSVKFGR